VLFFLLKNKKIMKAVILLVIIIIAFNTGANAQKISPNLFGQNHWMDKSDEGSRPGYIYMLWPKIKASGIKTVRIGGGGYERRLPKRETLTAIIDSIQSIGAEPVLQVPSTYTADQATELVKFFNKNPDRKPIKYWSIGNEPLLRVRNNHEAMMKALEEVVYPFLTRLAPAMKAADPTIKILVFDCEGLPVDNTEKFNYEAYEALCGGRLDITGKDKNGNWMVDGITFHSYPNNRNYTRDHVVFSSTYMIRQSTKQLLELIDRANRKNGRTGDAKLMWGLTEINVTAGNPDREITGIGCPSFLGGQFIAEMYGIGMENGALVVSPWSISETDRVRTDFGYIGLPTDFYPRSSYYHTQMMAQNMKGEFMPTASSNSYVKTIGSKSDDEICIMILNRDQAHDFIFDLILNKAGDSPKPLAVHADAGLNKTITDTIPNQTTMMFLLSKTGEIKKKYIYGITQNLKNLPPDVK
jgi:hypothetical protein